MDEVKQFVDYLKDLQLYVTIAKPLKDYLVKYANETTFRTEKEENSKSYMKKYIKSERITKKKKTKTLVVTKITLTFAPQLEKLALNP